MLPSKQGLYDPRFEHDACGVSFVADLHGRASPPHGGARACSSLCNLDHRGATNAEVNVGDGAGILIQVPDRFLRAVVGLRPPAGRLLRHRHRRSSPATPRPRRAARTGVEKIAASEGLQVLGWRDVPIDNSHDRAAGRRRRAVVPPGVHHHRRRPPAALGHRPRPPVLRRAQAGRARARDRRRRRVLPEPLGPHPRVQGHAHRRTRWRRSSPTCATSGSSRALALVHSRFSTNTFPSWPLAHPYRFIAHNGEINTVMGNENWMRAREALLDTDLIDGLDRAFPICTPGSSDTARFDEVLELLHLGGYSLPHAVLMMIPEAWENHESMPDWKRDFYRFHASLMEPWDGPASIAFTDGTVIGAVLDRNGLRPSRYWVTDDGLVVMASRGRRAADRPVHRRAEGPPAARPHVPHRHEPRPHRRRRRDQGGAGRPAALRRVAPRRARAPRRPPGARLPHAAARVGGEAPAGVRLHHRGAEDPARADGAHRRRADRLDGHRHAGRRAVGSLAAAVRLLPAAVRAGHQPAARRDPRGAGHLDGQHDRARGQPAAPGPGDRAGRWCSPTRSSPTTSWPSSSTSTTTTTCRASSPSPSTACSAWPRAATGCGGRSRTCAPR